MSMCFFDKFRQAISEPISFQIEVTNNKVVQMKQESEEETGLIHGAKQIAEFGIATFEQCLEAMRKFKNVDQACDYLLSRLG